MDTIFKEYTFPAPAEMLEDEVRLLLDSHHGRFMTEDYMKKAFGCIDLTSLNTTDTAPEIRDLCSKVSDFHKWPKHVGIPNVAAVCIYPALLPVAREALRARYVKLASVAAGFPAAQTFHELKVREIEMAVEQGATEIDIVLSVGKLLENRTEDVLNEIIDYKHAAKSAHLKVILETGALNDPQRVFQASLLAMEGGADFLKTSTGKGYPGANEVYTYVMAQAIAQYYQKRGRAVGIKAAGGVSTARHVATYMAIVDQVLGREWLTKEHFRIGASRLANTLLEQITEKDSGQDVGYF